MSASYVQSPRTTPSRHAERATYDAGTVHTILDSAFIGHLAYVDDNLPRLLPMLFVRVGESVFLHSSTGAHPARLTARRRGVRAVFEVTIVDGLVLARSAFSHSANYRAVVAHGELSLVSEPDRKDEVLRALLEKLVPGRSADARAPELSELRQTAVLELPLDDVGAKVRSGGPLDDERDLALGCWAGVLPIEARFAAPIPADGMHTPVPGYLSSLDGAPTWTST